MTSTMQGRADMLARNPYNFRDSRYGGGMSCHEFTAAQFEREGRLAPLRAECPYKLGTMAADRWQAGREAAALS